VASDIEDLSIRDVTLNYRAGGEDDRSRRLVAVGPMSLTWMKGATPDAGWVEVFNPNAVCTLRRLRIAGIRERGADGGYEPCQDRDRLVMTRRQRMNPDFPRTMPRGGTGYGRIEDVTNE